MLRQFSSSVCMCSSLHPNQGLWLYEINFICRTGLTHCVNFVTRLSRFGGGICESRQAEILPQKRDISNAPLVGSCRCDAERVMSCPGSS
eukprot:4462118-Prymnesium_polylepis.1